MSIVGRALQPTLNVDLKLCASCVHAGINFKPRSDDLMIVTPPKCGTTWVCQVQTLNLALLGSEMARVLLLCRGKQQW